MGGAGVAALPVDDHGARLDEAHHPRGGTAAKQDGGPEVVARHVVVHVGDVHSEPDLGGQVDDGVGARQEPVKTAATTQRTGRPLNILMR